MVKFFILVKENRKFLEREANMDMENITPISVISRARLFRIKGIVSEGLIRIKVDMNHPDRIVPKARRFRALDKLGSSSLVGGRGEKEGGLKKQK